MRTISTPFLALSLLATQCRNAAPQPTAPRNRDSTAKSRKLYFSDSGVSFITLKRDTLYGFPEIEETSRSQSSHFVHFTEYGIGDRMNRYALIRELSLQYSSDAPNGERKGDITLTANIPNVIPIQDSCNLYRVDWQTRISANQVNYRETYIEAVAESDDVRTRTLIDYVTGQPLLELSSDLYGVQLPDGYDRRWIGYADKTELMSGHGTVGILSYADPIRHRVQRLIIGSVDPSFYKQEEFASLSLEGVHSRPDSPVFTVNDDDSGRWYYSDVKKFYIVIRFDGRKNFSLRIPVVADTLDISRLNPDWCSLEIK